MVGARHLEHYDWTRAANGELTRVLSVDEHKEEEQTGWLRLLQLV